MDKTVLFVVFLNVFFLSLSLVGTTTTTAETTTQPQRITTDDSDVFDNIANMVAAELEAEANTLGLEFYLMSDSEWKEKTDAFKRRISTYATEFCSDENTMEKCGLSKWQDGRTFIPDDVKIQGNREIKNGYTVNFTIEFPSSISDDVKTKTRFVVNKAALNEIVTENRDKLNKEVGSIVGIGNDSYTPPPPNKTNQIMLIIAFLVLLLVIIIALVLHFYSKKESRDAKRKARERRKREKKAETAEQKDQKRDTQAASGKPSDINGRSNIHHPNREGDSMPPQHNRKHQSKRQSVYSHREEDDHQGYNTESTYVDNHTVEIPDTSYRGNQLPPMDSDEERRIRKKHKKEKKKKRRHYDEENPAYEQETHQRAAEPADRQHLITMPTQQRGSDPEKDYSGSNQDSDQDRQPRNYSQNSYTTEL